MAKDVEITCKKCGKKETVCKPSEEYKLKLCYDCHKMPAFPPQDYKGSLGQWCQELQERGLWDGINPDFHGDVYISANEWWEILEECEGCHQAK